MAHYGILKNAAVAEGAEDIRGAHIYSSKDGKLGKIEDVVFDHSSGDIRYVVVDTGGWLSTKKFLVPVEAIRTSTEHKNDFEVDLTKDQIERFPAYNESDLESENRWSGYEGKYRSKWVTNPVMHRAETDRNITPTTKQTTGNLQSERAAAAAHGIPPATHTTPSSQEESAEINAALRPTERVAPPGTDTVVINNTAVGIGDRWDTFQSRLRERRKEAVALCQTCAGESAVKRGSESVENLRKAV